MTAIAARRQVHELIRWISQETKIVVTCLSSDQLLGAAKQSNLSTLNIIEFPIAPKGLSVSFSDVIRATYLDTPYTLYI